MNDVGKSGRTPWDALIELLSARHLLLLAIGFFLVLFFVVHISAEPGTTVEFLGVIKYQKGKSDAPKAADETDSYVLPKNVEILREKTVPILDGSLAVQKMLIGGQIVGANIGKIRVACRGIDGTPYDLTRSYNFEAILFMPNNYIEIEYRGKVFSMTAVQGRNGSIAISLAKIPRATLDNLVSIKKIPIPTS